MVSSEICRNRLQISLDPRSRGKQRVLAFAPMTRDAGDLGDCSPSYLTENTPRLFFCGFL
jgi:hypothetical protein